MVEYYRGEWSAAIKLKAGNYVKTDFAALANKYKDADVFIYAGGISPQLEGEMPVSVPGFKGGDHAGIFTSGCANRIMQKHCRLPR